MARISMDMGIVSGLLGRLDADERAAAVSAVRSDPDGIDEDRLGVRLGMWPVSASASR